MGRKRKSNPQNTYTFQTSSKKIKLSHNDIVQLVPSSVWQQIFDFVFDIKDYHSLLLTCRGTFAFLCLNDAFRFVRVIRTRRFDLDLPKINFLRSVAVPTLK